jgi:hypothetical protein
VSTTVRPTLLPYAELSQHAGIAAFVADYIAYDPLPDPTKAVRGVLAPAPSHELH